VRGMPFAIVAGQILEPRPDPFGRRVDEDRVVEPDQCNPQVPMLG
jgi:hypothetical protein